MTPCNLVNNCEDSQRNLTLSVLNYKFEEHLSNKSLGSAVGITNGYWLRDGAVRVRVPVESIIFTSPYRPDPLWGPLNLLYNGYQRLFPPGVKRQGRKANHSTPTSAEVKKMWIYTSTPPYAFME
jgi:hypothetical protein